MKSLATAIILAHNHPRWKLNQSAAYESLSSKIKEAGKYHYITVFDHLTITCEGYFSFADEGRL